MGLTGFDSGVNGQVSMSGHVTIPVKQGYTILNGETNFALAA